MDNQFGCEGGFPFLVHELTDVPFEFTESAFAFPFDFTSIDHPTFPHTSHPTCWSTFPNRAIRIKRTTSRPHLKLLKPTSGPHEKETEKKRRKVTWQVSTSPCFFLNQKSSWMTWHKLTNKLRTNNRWTTEQREGKQKLQNISNSALWSEGNGLMELYVSVSLD